MDEATALMLGAGFLGAFTTMSTFSVETIRLLTKDAGPPPVRTLSSAAWFVRSSPFLAGNPPNRGLVESLEDGQHSVQRQQRAGLDFLRNHDLVGYFAVHQALQDVHQIGGVNHVHR